MAYQGPNDPQPTGGGGGGDIGAIVAAGAGLLDSRWNRKAAEENTDKTIAANKAEAELAYQRSLAMWHMQNAYNSPEEQMKRFGAAGLNPHLIYGQGNSGNASSTPQYNPPNIQYKYAAAEAGPAVQAGIGTLMAVGSWMQNMRLTETEIKAKETGISKVEQLVNFLRMKNPRELEKMDNELSVFPYQEQAIQAKADEAQAKTANMLEQFRYDWGVPLQTSQNAHTYSPAGGGAKQLDYLRKAAEARLKSHQADWFEPATIMRLVMSGIMGMTRLPGFGKTVGKRASTGPINPKARRVKTFYQDGKRRSQVVDY